MSREVDGKLAKVHAPKLKPKMRPKLVLPPPGTSPVETLGSNTSYSSANLASPTQKMLAMKEVKKIVDDSDSDGGRPEQGREAERQPEQGDEENLQMQMMARQAYMERAIERDEKGKSFTAIDEDIEALRPRAKLGLVDSPGKLQKNPTETTTSASNLADFVLPPGDFPGVPRRIQEIAEREFRMEELRQDELDEREESDSDSDGGAVNIRGAPPLTMFTQMKDEMEDVELLGDDKYSIVNLFAAEILRQQQVENIFKSAVEGGEGDCEGVVEEDEDNFSEDEEAMMLIKNTRDVMDGKPVKMEPKASPVKSSQAREPSIEEEQDDDEDYYDDEFEQAEASQVSEPNQSQEEEDHQPSPLEDNKSEDKSDPLSSSLSSTYSHSNSTSLDHSAFTVNGSTTNTSTSQVRLTASELQAQLLKELALSDALTEQLLQLNDIEKNYTIATANAETAQVASTFQRHKEDVKMADEIRAQQHAFEMTLHQAVSNMKGQFTQNQQISAAPSTLQPLMDPESSGSYESVTPSKSPKTPKPPASLERSASMYSEDFDVDDSQVSTGSASNMPKEFTDLRNEHAAAAERRRREEERLLAVREQAVREIYERQIKALEGKGGDSKSERKKLRRQKAASLAAINQERWAIRGRGYRDEEMFSRLWNDDVPFMAPFVGGESQFNVYNVAAAPLSEDLGDETLSEELQTSTAASIRTDDDSQFIEMKRKLEQLKRRKGAAERLISMKKKRGNISEEVRRTQALTEQLEREAMSGTEKRRGRSRERSRSVMSQGTAGTEGDAYLSDSFESFEGDKSVRSNRSGRSQRSRSITRRETSETIEYENDNVTDDSSEFMSSVEDEHEVKEDAPDTVEEETSLQLSAEKRRENFMRSRQSLASEVSEAPSYGMESFESFSDTGTGTSRARQLQGRGKEKAPVRGSGLGAGLQIDVPAGAGDNDLGTLTIGTSAPLSRQSSFGEGQRKTKASRRENADDKENVDGNLSDDSDGSLDRIKNRVRELQKLVDEKNKAKRRAQEKRSLIELEAQLKMELIGGEASESMNSRRSARSGRSKSPAASGRSNMREESLFQPSEVSAEANGRMSVSPGPSLSASALSTSGFGREISGPSFNASGHGVGMNDFMEPQGEDGGDDIDSAVDSDSFQSRSSGVGSDEDGEVAVRRTERRMKKFRMAALIQARMRGILDRIRVNHRRAVLERMVRKARFEEVRQSDELRRRVFTHCLASSFLT